jgi:alkanesulfonate monooxygenase SsuD/methylene tetrahydromethanopterin reductase-like flavin-dependent oxidoreductase (luciferase family)
VTTAAPLEPRFGLFLGQAGKAWEQVLDEFSLAEELGFDHAWLVDHLTPTDGPREVPILEAWTLLAAIAARTQRIRLGVLVTNNLFRNPALLLKEATTVDHISGGRLILGLGAGWFGEEHRRFGFPFPSAAARVERLEETVTICRLLMAQGRATFHGRHYRLDDAILAPRPVNGHIPLLVAGHRPATIDLAARYADQWDTFPRIEGASTDGVTEGLAGQMRRFRDACRAAGRDPDTIRRSTWTGSGVVATPGRYRAYLTAMARLGFTDFTTGLPADRSALRSIVHGVIPALRAAG